VNPFPVILTTVPGGPETDDIATFVTLAAEVGNAVKNKPVTRRDTTDAVIKEFLNLLIADPLAYLNRRIFGDIK
jgi:hypothetical protein